MIEEPELWTKFVGLQEEDQSIFLSIHLFILEPVFPSIHPSRQSTIHPSMQLPTNFSLSFLPLYLKAPLCTTFAFFFHTNYVFLLNLIIMKVFWLVYNKFLHEILTLEAYIFSSKM